MSCISGAGSPFEYESACRTEPMFQYQLNQPISVSGDDRENENDLEEKRRAGDERSFLALPNQRLLFAITVLPVMTSLFSIYRWGSIPLEYIPKDTHSLLLYDIPAHKEVHQLFAALPHLTRLTCHAYPLSNIHPKVYEGMSWALKQTPHINYLNLRNCGLTDRDLFEILKGCSLDLCELQLKNNQLKFEDGELTTLLACSTNLQ